MRIFGEGAVRAAGMFQEISLAENFVDKVGVRQHEVTMLKGINGILISSRDPARLIEFYKKIGFDLKMEDHGQGLHAECEFGGVHFAIWGMDARVRSFIWGKDDQSAGSNITFSLNVPALEETHKKLAGEGIVFEAPPTPLPFGGVLAILKDPDGNRIIMMRWQEKG